MWQAKKMRSAKLLWTILFLAQHFESWGFIPLEGHKMTRHDICGCRSCLHLENIYVHIWKSTKWIAATWTKATTKKFKARWIYREACEKLANEYNCLILYVSHSWISGLGLGLSGTARVKVACEPSPRENNEGQGSRGITLVLEMNNRCGNISPRDILQWSVFFLYMPLWLLMQIRPYYYLIEG